MTIQTVTDAIRYVGVDDNTLALFENQYPVQPMGVSYNSYVILDEKIAVMDSVDARAAEEWLSNVAQVLEGRNPDYLVVTHMEPDHSGSLMRLAQKYPEMKIVGNAKTFTLIKQFFGTGALSEDRMLEVGERDTLSMFKENHHKTDKIPSSLIQTNKKALIYIMKNPRLANLMVMMSICMSAIMFINSYTQPLLISKGIEMVLLGPLMFVFNLLMSWGAKLQKRLSSEWAHYIIALFIGLCTIIMGITSPIFCLVTIAWYRILNGMIFPQIVSASNKLLKDNIRATVMSFQSMMTSLLSIAIEPVVGFGLDRWGISKFYKYWGIIYTGLIIIIIIGTISKPKVFKA